MFHRVFEIFEERLAKPCYRKLLLSMTEESEITLLGICCQFANMLGLVSRHLPDFFDEEKDPRITANIILARYLESRLPGSVIRVQSQTNFRGGPLVKVAFASDATYQFPLWFDFNLYDKRSAMMNSTWFGLGAAYDFKLLYDCRPMEYVLRGMEWKTGEERITINGKTIGIIKDFASLPAVDQSLPTLPVAKRWVVQATCDFHCPQSGRLLWQQNTVYGTPYYSYELYYPPLKLEERSFFRVNLLAKTSANSDGNRPVPQYGNIRDKYHSLHSLLVKKEEVFQYSEASDHLYLGTGKFARGSVARMLVSMLREYTRSGKTEFPFVSMKYDNFISVNPKSSGFETNVKRLRSRLQIESNNLRLISIDRGKARLEVRGPVRLENSH